MQAETPRNQNYEKTKDFNEQPQAFNRGCLQRFVRHQSINNMKINLSESHHGVTVEISVEILPQTYPPTFQAHIPSCEASELADAILLAAFDSSRNQLIETLRQLRLLIEVNLAKSDLDSYRDLVPND
jgi:hypothetical protein